ncbi:MAG TPA: DUF5916 domain-containing protein [Candidatus Acidoferrum sp.]|nr:DUF5916 domain-containing protein [Candidatus Acidoferrum sp.]
MLSRAAGARIALVVAALEAVRLSASSGTASAAPATGADVPPTLTIARVSGAIAIDGSLDEDAWKGLAPIESWYETTPGDNTVPALKNVGYLGYDDKFLYAGFEFEDPQPDSIRAPISDRDNVPNSTDYGGVIIDPSNTGKTAVLLLVNARGVQYDAVSDDTSGSEDSSPDFFWDSAARIHDRGWSLEIRIPFSSLRYPRRDPQTWRIMLYRNRARDFRYQFFTTRLPRGGNCFICRSNVLVGLERLPAGGGIVFAPYASGNYQAIPKGELGSPLEDSFEAAAGFDGKWRPNASTVIDATVNPDFSQIESDVAKIAANERFALSFPEKQPFFLEGAELLLTPLQAVYTRTVTDPQWGARATGRAGGLAYTGIVVQDEGGGSVVIPRPNSSDLVDQDFRSWVGIGRMRYELGESLVGALATSREIEGGGHNRVAGPDFEWRPGQGDSVTGQLLLSWTRTPERPELADDWDGRAFQGHAGRAQWKHSSPRIDWVAFYREVSEGFRADDGFIPQAGFREGSGELGYTFRPEAGLLRRVRPFAIYDRLIDFDDELLVQHASAGIGLDGLLSSSVTLSYADDRILADTRVLPRQQLVYEVYVNPSMTLSQITLIGSAGQQIDFENARTGTGADIALGLTVRPTPHLELVLNESLRWLDVRSGGEKQRLFTARVDRLRATYSFSSRMFIRAIGQYEVTRRDPDLYLDEVPRKDATLTASALLAFKLDWQSVLFVGYGDDQIFSSMTRSLEPEARQLFLKFSYAYQL